MELLQEQKQLQTLSPQLIQSMEILQMSTLELQEYVEEQLLENPVLEREESRPQEDGSQLLHKLEWLAASGRQTRRTVPDDSRDWMDTVVQSTQESLYDHLGAQIPWKTLPPALRRGVEGVLTGLNDSGWLEETPEELAERCSVDPRVIAQAEELVRSLDPAGVGARTLPQCLELQLKRMGKTGLALIIVQRHLEGVAKHHYNQIAQASGASREAIQQACRLIRSLNPRPGAAFVTHSLPAYITPDLIVTEDSGQLTVLFADQPLPELKISPYYQNLMNTTEEESVKDYLSGKLRQADWVLRCIEQRRETILRCVRSIAERQGDFFRRSKHFLRPMSLAEVAADLGVHESTVSRAVKNKYIQCTWGLFPLSIFFSRALPSGSEDISAEQAKQAIRDLIGRETKSKPLSDQKLCDELAAQGLTLSRRTVAKYRDEMGIPSAPGRKEF